MHRIDAAQPLELTAKQRAELRALAAKSDADIDLSDIPVLDENFWLRAKRFRSRADRSS
jgi:hypothetical protein